MADYARRRDRFLRSPSSPCFFLNDRGSCLEDSEVRRTFYDLSRQIGLRGPDDRKRPRLHDFRHRFAVRTFRGSSTKPHSGFLCRKRKKP
jgi:hypothetical protein